MQAFNFIGFSCLEGMLYNGTKFPRKTDINRLLYISDFLYSKERKYFALKWNS
jgi:hypothetical protein